MCICLYRMIPYDSHSNYLPLIRMDVDININADKYDLLQQALEKIKKDDDKIRAIDWMYERRYNESGMDTTTKSLMYYNVNFNLPF